MMVSDVFPDVAATSQAIFRSRSSPAWVLPLDGATLLFHLLSWHLIFGVRRIGKVKLKELGVNLFFSYSNSHRKEDSAMLGRMKKSCVAYVFNLNEQAGKGSDSLTRSKK